MLCNTINTIQCIALCSMTGSWLANAIGSEESFTGHDGVT